MLLSQYQFTFKKTITSPVPLRLLTTFVNYADNNFVARILRNNKFINNCFYQ